MSAKGILGLIGTGVGIIVLIICILIFTERVPEGKVAVVYSPSGGAKEVLNPGWHGIGFFEKTQEFPTRPTIVETKVSVTTSDGKKITMPVSYQIKVEKTKVLNIFKELGSQNIEQIQEGYVYQKLFKASRSVVSGYSVLDIFGTKTTEASLKVTDNLASSVANLGFIITDVTLGNPEVDKATQDAIDSRIKASQQLEQKKIDIQLAKSEADRLAIVAKGTANKKVIEAQGTSDANKLLEKSITPELLKLKEMEARLKHGWVTVKGSGGVITQQ